MDKNEENAGRDEFFEAQVQRALRPYRSWLHPTQLAALETTVRDTLENDPIAAELLQAARPRKAPPMTEEKDVPGTAQAPRKDPIDGRK